MSIDQTPARDITLYGDSDNWPPINRPPDYGLGTSLGHGAWVEHAVTLTKALVAAIKRRDPKMTRTIWRNADTSNGDLWSQPGRFGSIEVWQPKKATGWFPHQFFRDLKQFALDLDAVRTPLVVPWLKGWREVGGTQAQAADNGCIIVMSDGTSYEVQGMAPLSAWDVLQINARCLPGKDQTFAKLGDYRVDAITHRRPGVTPHGSQGPVWKADGLLRPDHLERFVPDVELSLVLPNTEWGPEARAVPPGWVEHRNSQPFAGRMGGAQIPDVGRGKVINFVGLAVDITDAEIEQWLAWCEVNAPGPLPSSRRWLARNLRGYETDADRPAELDTRIRGRESGTGRKLLESNGDVAGFARHGVVDANAGQLAAGILRFGRLVVTDGLEVAA